MGKKSFSREAAEKAEGLEQVKNDLPENRVQNEQQIQNTDAALKTEGSKSSFQPKSSTAKGQALKQQVISDAITGSTGSAGMGISAAGRGVSGTAGGVLGANNSTPRAEKSRSDTRVGKKLDRIATKLNYTPCETVLLKVDESKPLADAATLDQGFNGTYRNDFGRSQKIMGAVPADLMFQRSVDLILKDKLYFVEGQQVFQNADDRLALNPSVMCDFYSNNSKKVIPATIHTGNYLHRNMHIGLGSDGKVTYVYFDVEDLTGDPVSAADANVASAHRLIKSNVAELDRMAMDAKAGDEKADIWSPLPRAIPEPTQWSYLLSSIEADTGAYIYLAYSKATTNMSYQLNRGAKDGLSIVIPALEQLMGWRASVDKSTDFADSTVGGFASLADYFENKAETYHARTNFRAGDPSLMIAAYDSVGKYNNKADLLLQPRGWRMHLQTADNNMNAFRVPTEFAQVYAGNEVFSTIDHEYDPLLPICMTDKANLITAHNLNELAAFHKFGGYRALNGKVSYAKIVSDYAHTKVILAKAGVPAAMGWEKIFVYTNYNALDGIDYNSGIITINADTTNRTNSTYAAVVSPVALDVTTATSKYYGFTKKAELTASEVDYDIAVYVPKVDSTGTNAVSASTFEVSETMNEWHYIRALTDAEKAILAIKAHDEHSYDQPLIAYRYDDLRNNYIIRVKHPLVFGIVEYLNEAIGGKIRSLIDREEFNVPLIFSTQYMTLAQLLICAATPWIQRVRLNSMKDIIYYEDNVGVYPFSKLSLMKDVPFKNYVNFSYTDYDSPLVTKVMNPVQALNWVMPEFFWKLDTGKYVLPWSYCENELNADGSVNEDESCMCMPSIRSGIRLGALDTLYGMTEKDIRLSLDRMTKTFLRDEDITAKYAYKYGRMTDGQIVAVLDTDKLFTIKKILSAPRELGLTLDAPLGVLTVNPASGKNFSTGLAAFTADGTETSFRIKIWTNVNTIQHPNILSSDGVNVNRAANYSQKWFEISACAATSNLDLSGLIFGLGDDAAEYAPFAALGTGAAADISVTINSKQRSMYTRLQLLPFVLSPFDGVSGLTYPYDIYDFAYYFGLCGFRASDFRESVYNREKEVVNQGMLFINDPWVEASPIVKGGSVSTGLTISKGYELK